MGQVGYASSGEAVKRISWPYKFHWAGDDFWDLYKAEKKLDYYGGSKTLEVAPSSTS